MSRDNGAPVFGSWVKAYGIALGVFGLEILFLYAFTVVFS